MVKICKLAVRESLYQIHCMDLNAREPVFRGLGPQK